MVPCLITPALKIFDGDIPYLQKDGLHSKDLSQEEVTALTGVKIDEDGNLLLDPSFLQTYMCAAADNGKLATPAAGPKSGAPVSKSAKGKKGGEGESGAGSGADGESRDAPETGDDLQSGFGSRSCGCQSGSYIALGTIYIETTQA